MTHEIPRNDHYVGGESIIWQYTIEKEDGTAKNLSGATVDWYLFNSRGEDTADALLDTSSNGISVTITDAANGKAEVEIDGSATEDLAGGRYWQRLVVVDDSGNTQIWNGDFPIQQK